MTKSITIKDIAKYARVSLGTASKVMNNKGNVAPELRRRVEEVIRKFNYTPSALAGSFKRKKTNIIGLITPQILNSFYVQVIDVIEKKVRQKGYNLFLGNSSEDIDVEAKLLRDFSRMRVDGLILASSARTQETRIFSELQSYESLNLPIVLVVRELEKVSFDTVTLDNVGGAYQATQFLINSGHRQIGIISSSIHTSASQERIDGYKKALKEHKIHFAPNLVHVGGWTPNSGYDITSALLDLDHAPTALFVASNVQMLGALRSIKNRNLRIPRDISLIGFDDTEWSSFAAPPLTVVRPLLQDLCDWAVRLLFDRIEKRYSGRRRRKIIPTELIVRDSVAAIEMGHTGKR